MITTVTTSTTSTVSTVASTVGISAGLAFIAVICLVAVLMQKRIAQRCHGHDGPRPLPRPQRRHRPPRPRLPDDPRSQGHRSLRLERAAPSAIPGKAGTQQGPAASLPAPHQGPTPVPVPRHGPSSNGGRDVERARLWEPAPPGEAPQPPGQTAAGM